MEMIKKSTVSTDKLNTLADKFKEWTKENKKFTLDEMIEAKVYVEANLQEKEITPAREVIEVQPDEGFDGLEKVIVQAIPNEYVVPDGQLEVAESGIFDVKEYAEVKVADEDLIPTNIRAGKTIFGVEGNLEPDKPDQVKEITPTKEEQIVAADTGYELAQVAVKPIPEEYVSTIDATANASDIRIGKTAYSKDGKVEGTIEDYDGSYEGDAGKAYEFNIHCGLDEPTDISKLWVKKDFNPQNVTLTSTDLQQSYKRLNLSGETGQAAVLVDNKIYFILTPSFKTTTVIQSYDIESNIITTLTTLCEGERLYTHSAVVNNKIYFIGGGFRIGYSDAVYHKNIYIYDIQNNTVESLIDILPDYLLYTSPAVVGKKIYLFGGINDTTNKESIDNIYVFDTETKDLTTLNTILPEKLCDIGAVTVDDKVYLMGGTYNLSSSSRANTILLFNTKNDEIETLDIILPFYRGSITGVLYNNIIYFISGQNNYNSSTNTICTYDLQTQTITQKHNLKFGDTVHRCFKILLYKNRLIGLDYSWIINYMITINLNRDSLSLQNSSNNFFKLLNSSNYNIEVGVSNAWIGNSSNEGEKVKIAVYNGTKWVEIN